MAAKKKSTKKTRQSTPKGELPGNLTRERLERALDYLNISKAQMVKALEETAAPRGRAASPLTAAQKSALKSFMEGKSSKDEAMEKAGVKTPGAFLNLMERYNEA